MNIICRIFSFLTDFKEVICSEKAKVFERHLELALKS